MTLGDGKRKVYMLIDEYSSGGTVTPDADIEAKMADFFDIAQKQVAKIQRIIKSYTVPREEGKTLYDMPEDFDGLYHLWYDGKVRNSRFRWSGRRLVIPKDAAGDVEAEYFAMPETIGPDTPDEHEFQVRDDAANAMCFFVAAQQLIVDLVLDYSALYQMYQLLLSNLDTRIPGQGVSGVMNTFFVG